MSNTLIDSLEGNAGTDTFICAANDDVYENCFERKAV